MRKLYNIPLIILLFCLSSRSITSSPISSTEAPSLTRELTIPELEYYISTDEGREVLENEFNIIKSGQRKPWTVAALPENLKKNRYSDLLAYDATRVVLNLLPDDPNSDYINANYIDGQYRNHEYVATQGPLNNTLNDFWRMIWQLNVTKIVMLANIIEHGEIKVEKYWPENKEIYDDISVTLVSEYEIPYLQHNVRTFLLQKGNAETNRIVRHFHFTGWPDLGVPSNVLAAISIIEQARKYKVNNQAPIVVHCSAGVGRTGTIILTDSMIQKAKQERIVDFPKRLDSMRLQRVDVVEKKEQYIFAHKATYEFLIGNKTEEFMKKVDDEYENVEKKFKTDFLILALQNLFKYTPFG